MIWRSCSRTRCTEGTASLRADILTPGNVPSVDVDDFEEHFFEGLQSHALQSPDSTQRVLRLSRCDVRLRSRCRRCPCNDGQSFFDVLGRTLEGLFDQLAVSSPEAVAASLDDDAFVGDAVFLEFTGHGD